MAIFIVENNGKISYGIKRYVCKTMADIPVEVNGEEIAPGSKVYVSDEKKTYMLNTAGQWVEIKEGGGASALSDLADVDISGTIQGGKVLKYNAVEEKWVPGDDEGGTELPVPTTADIGKSLVVESDGQGGTQYAYDINSCVELTQAEYDLLTTEQKMNGSIYKITDNAKMYCLDKAYHPVEECTVAEYNQKTSAQQNDGTIYIQTDAETTGEDIPVNTLTPDTSINSAINACFGRTGEDIPVNTLTPDTSINSAINACFGRTASDIPYSQGVSVADKIDELSAVTTGQVTLDTTIIDGGGITYTKIGKIVIVDVNVRFKANIAADSAICSGLPSGSFVHFLLGVSQNAYRAYFDRTTIKMSDVPPAAYCTGMFVYKAN